MVGVSRRLSAGAKARPGLGQAARRSPPPRPASPGRCRTTVRRPGPVPAAPSNRDYAPGFMAALMLKDMKLSQAAAEAAGVADAARRACAVVLPGGGGCRGRRRRIFRWYSVGWRSSNAITSPTRLRRGVRTAEGTDRSADGTPWTERSRRHATSCSRTAPTTARRMPEFRWPQLDHFNYALDWFDAELAHGDERRPPRAEDRRRRRRRRARFAELSAAPTGSPTACARSASSAASASC